jgi:hypothetical protein
MRAATPKLPQRSGSPTRTGSGRRSALVEKIRPSDLPADGANATVVVTVDEQALRDRVGAATLSCGGEVSASEARRLACAADILPAVLAADSHVLDLGRARRLIDRPQRIAIAVRDGGCVFPGCDRPPGWTDAHHIQPWSEGGNTDLSKARCPAGTTTASSTETTDKTAGRSAWATTDSPRSRRLDASTPTDDPSDTNDSAPDNDDEIHPAPKPPDTTPSGGHQANPAAAHRTRGTHLDNTTEEVRHSRRGPKSRSACWASPPQLPNQASAERVKAARRASAAEP